MTAYLFSARGSAAFTPLQCPAGRPRWELQALAPIPNCKRAEARAPGTLNTYVTAAAAVSSPPGCAGASKRVPAWKAALHRGSALNTPMDGRIHNFELSVLFTKS